MGSSAWLAGEVEPLAGRRVSKARRGMVLANYKAHVGPDMAVAAMAAPRGMAAPTEGTAPSQEDHPVPRIILARSANVPRGSVDYAFLAPLGRQ